MKIGVLIKSQKKKKKYKIFNAIQRFLCSQRILTLNNSLIRINEKSYNGKSLKKNSQLLSNYKKNYMRIELIGQLDP